MKNCYIRMSQLIMFVGCAICQKHWKDFFQYTLPLFYYCYWRKLFFSNVKEYSFFGILLTITYGINSSIKNSNTSIRCKCCKFAVIHFPDFLLWTTGAIFHLLCQRIQKKQTKCHSPASLFATKTKCCLNWQKTRKEQFNFQMPTFYAIFLFSWNISSIILELCKLLRIIATVLEVSYD